MKIQIAFYKNTSATVYDRLIAWWTKSCYTHVEIVIDNTWYSSSPRDNGVRIKHIDLNHDNWDFVEMKMDSFDVERIKTFFQKHLNKKYDWIGIVFSQVIPLQVQDPDKWFCSEIVHKALRYSGVRLHKCSQCISPGDLYKALQEIK